LEFRAAGFGRHPFRCMFALFGKFDRRADGSLVAERNAVCQEDKSLAPLLLNMSCLQDLHSFVKRNNRGWSTFSRSTGNACLASARVHQQPKSEQKVGFA
jgi:hypothetical protein